MARSHVQGAFYMTYDEDRAVNAGGPGEGGRGLGGAHPDASQNSTASVCITGVWVILPSAARLSKNCIWLRPCFLA